MGDSMEREMERNREVMQSSALHLPAEHNEQEKPQGHPDKTRVREEMENNISGVALISSNKCCHIGDGAILSCNLMQKFSTTH